MLYVVLFGLFTLLLFTFFKVVTHYAFPPTHFPKNIPTIPFYFTLLPLFKEVDQEDLYRRYLEAPLSEHGAVKIFFGGTWNVLVTRPAYIVQVLKQDEVFPKAGNHVKNPHGILALYTGVNIISSIGETWKHFTSIIRPGLQADLDSTIIVKNTKKLIKLLLVEQDRDGQVLMPGHLQEYALANLSEVLLGSSFDVGIHTRLSQDSH